MTKLLFLAFLLALNSYAKAAVPAVIAGDSLLGNKKISVSIRSSDKKGLVLVFLSAKCPCSNSHMKLLKKTAEQYKNFRFLAVHSNADESRELSEKYFSAAGLSFEVVQDKGSVLADQFQAYKTPHVFVFNSAGEILYQGGMTNSSHADSADRHYLEDALADISAGQKVRVAEGRTLGCVILRENEIYAK